VHRSSSGPRREDDQQNVRSWTALRSAKFDGSQWKDLQRPRHIGIKFVTLSQLSVTYIKALVKKSNYVSLLVKHAQLSHLVLKEQLKFIRTLVVFRFRRVIHATIGKDPGHVSDEEALCDIISVEINRESITMVNSFMSPTHLFFNLSPMLLRSIGYLMCS
jgi:hypothetical protein